MRDGRIVAEPSTVGLTEEVLVELMLGRPLERLVPESTSAAARQPVLSVRDLSGFRLRDFSCELTPGEIVGVTGLLGSGKTELGRLLSGAQHRRSGDVRIHGRPVRLDAPRDAVRAGIAYLRPTGGLKAVSGHSPPRKTSRCPDSRRSGKEADFSTAESEAKL